MKSIKDWAEKNRIAPPYLKSAINKIQDDKIEKVIVKKCFPTPDSLSERAFWIGVQLGNPIKTRLFLDQLLNGESFELRNPNGTPERIDPSDVILERKIPLPEKIICISNPIDDPPLFRRQYLCQPITEVDTNEAMTFGDEYKDFKRMHPKSSRKHLRNLIRVKRNKQFNR